MICVTCKAPLEKLSESWNCAACNVQYPIILGNTPVMVREPRRYLASNVIKYWKYLSTLAPHTAHTDSYRAAITSNIALFELLVESLTKSLSIQDIRHTISAAPSEEHADTYSFNTAYLLRDWAGEKAGEHEIAVIKESVRRNLKKGGRALVLGAGMARIAVEVSDLFDSVIAVDFEPNMAFFFDRLKASDFTVGEISLHNTLREEDQGRMVQVSTKHVDAHQLSTVQYALADARELPFEDSYFDVIFSVYFTDVLPVHTLLPEARRVLAPGGKFIHFGPLEYHFPDTTQKYAFERLVQFFQEMNFDVRQSESVELSHCRSAVNGSFRMYTNWIFTAIRKADVVITLQTFLTVMEEVTYSMKGQLSNGEGDEIAVQIPHRPGLMISDAMLDILKCIGSGCTVQEIIVRLEQDEGYEKPDPELTISFIDSLSRNGIIKVQ